MPPTLDINLVNSTASDNVFAFITGLDIDNGNAWFLLKADGRTAYHPPNPSNVGTPLAENCAIQLGKSGSGRTVTIPHIAGGRIYFSIDRPLTFFLNPGPALVEPSVTNPSDSNINLSWGFCEFTFNADQLYANISYVDFVSLPISLTLTNASGHQKHVGGMSSSGIHSVIKGLEAQDAADNVGWKSLVYKDPNGQVLRVLSPNQARVMDPNLFANYFEPYVDAVWHKFSSKEMVIDTQAAGIVRGKVHHGTLQLDEQSFAKPSTSDILSANSGPFQTGPDAKRNAIIPRLNAEFHRSTFLIADEFPAHPKHYYRHNVTNHYARIVHDANVDGKGYAHPYDDATPRDGPDQSGFVNDPAPKVLEVNVGGGGAGGGKHGHGVASGVGGGGHPPGQEHREHHGLRGMLHAAADRFK